MQIKEYSNIDPVQIFESMKDLPYAFFLDSCGMGDYSYIFSDPLEVLRGNPFKKIRESKKNGWWVGVLAYEMEGSVFGLYDKMMVFESNTWKSDEGGQSSAEPRLTKSIEGCQRAAPPRHVTQLRTNFTRQEYCQTIQKIQEYIAAGDCYQVNLSQRFETDYEGDSWELYKKLRELSPAPYAAYMNFGGVQILSSSPECFLNFDGQKVTTRPIKGTMPRGASPEEDEQFRRKLLESEKDKAELLMITDLHRNDLGRVCAVGSVQVQQLRQIESFSNVHHAVSTIEGELAKGKSHMDCVEACFPGGSITGAPKVRSMQIINELEKLPRSFYTGSIGFFGGDGSSHFNIAIRTMIAQKGKIQFHVGGGIVADSDPEMEYEETLAKAKGMIEALNL